MNNVRSIGFDDLAESPEFRVFFEMARDLTGIFVALVSPDGMRVKILHSRERETPLCRLINSSPAGHAACDATDRRWMRKAVVQKRALCYRCHAGLVDIAIPIHVNGRHVATINCGQVLPEPPSASAFKRLSSRLSRLKLSPKELRKAYFQSPYFPPDKIRTAVRLLSFFAEYFGEIGWRLKQLRRDQGDHFQKAVDYIHEHFQEPIRLEHVARAASLSAAYFSSQFHRRTGRTVRHYLNAERVNAAKRLLRSSSDRVTDIAYAVGFNSLTHFNRAFREIARCSPSRYRLETARRKRGYSVSDK